MSIVFVTTENRLSISIFSPKPFMGKYVDVVGTHMEALNDAHNRMADLQELISAEVDCEVDVVERETDDGVTVVRLIDPNSGDEYVAHLITEVKVS